MGHARGSETVAPFHVHNQACAVVASENLDDTCRCPDGTELSLLREQEAELIRVLHAFSDELLVALLKYVQGNSLSGKQHHIERKEPDLAHVTEPSAVECLAEPLLVSSRISGDGAVDGLGASKSTENISERRSWDR